MSYPRHLPLFDEGVRHGAWNERMIAGEYAIHYSSFEELQGIAPYCTVFGNFSDAEAYAQQQVNARPSLRCMIYDHQGLVGPPLLDIRGSSYKDDGDLLPRVRRWMGSVLFFGGLILIIVDWSAGFRFDWPSIIGNRILIVGLVLLFTEAMVTLHAKRERSRITDKRS
jgi:hypothetical protein